MGCCPPNTSFPFAQVCMLTPPACPAPTCPQPVRPLQLPCGCKDNNGCPPATEDEQLRTRYANFYNNYNLDYKCDGVSSGPPPAKKPCSDQSQKRPAPTKGCPTGFKICKMKMEPPPGCHPLGTWKAVIQPCPPKKTSNDVFYVPGPCTRPCCKHWAPKGGPCLYDHPCRAHCYEHPPGIKPHRTSNKC